MEIVPTPISTVVLYRNKNSVVARGFSSQSGIEGRTLQACDIDELSKKVIADGWEIQDSALYGTVEKTSFDAARNDYEEPCRGLDLMAFHTAYQHYNSQRRQAASLRERNAAA